MAEDTDDGPHGRAVDEACAGYEAPNVACRCRARNGWSSGLKQRAREEHSLEEVRELGVKGRIPEEEELCITRLECAQDGAFKDREQRVELLTPERTRAVEGFWGWRAWWELERTRERR